MSHEGTWLPRCVVCRESVNLTESKADEYGRAVHENCYYWTVILKKPPRSVVRAGPVRERQCRSFAHSVQNCTD